MKKIFFTLFVIIQISHAQNGEELYKKCISCHGEKANRSALGRSAIIKGWSEEKIIKSLNGYKNDTDGGSMKLMMKRQVQNLSKEDIESLAKYIQSLK